MATWNWFSSYNPFDLFVSCADITQQVQTHHGNLQGHSSLTPIYLYIHKMNFGDLRVRNSYPQLEVWQNIEWGLWTMPSVMVQFYIYFMLFYITMLVRMWIEWCSLRDRAPGWGYRVVRGKRKTEVFFKYSVVFCLSPLNPGVPSIMFCYLL